MRKKTVKKKIKSSGQASKKRKTLVHFTIRSFVSIIGIYLLVSLIYPLLSIKSSVSCANSISCAESLKLKVENDAVGIFSNRKVVPPKIAQSPDDTPTTVLGTKTTALGEKHIYIDLKEQKLYAYEGETLFMQTFVSTGKWGRTPKGDFTIWVKLRATRMSGGSGADYYDLPNVPFVMFFQNNQVSGGAGFSLHGTYWHNNFGHPMSHGCVNMRITDAEKLYNWANPSTNGYTTYADNKNQGTKITIYGNTPN